MTTRVPAIALNNGVELPLLGLGVFQSPPSETVGAVEAAIRSGYQLIDTAAAYANEREVGEGIRRSGISRDELFIETKVWISDYGYDATLHAFDKGVRKLGVEQLDLLLLHQPIPTVFDRTLEAYRALEKLLADGKVRAIGVSNFMPDHLARLNIQTLRYASPEGVDLLMDLCRPNGASGPLPVIVFIHGGAWRAGTRTTGPDLERFFARDGFAMASIDYRLTPDGVFPRSVEDVKTAVRFLRTHAAAYDLDPARIGYWGLSAGGHLAAVAALAPHGTFEGTEWLDESSAVRCVLDAYGPTWFTTMDEETSTEALARESRSGRRLHHDSPLSPESRLLGAPVQSVPDRVREASPITYASGAAPPFLIMHGLADDMVPVRQSVRLYHALVAAGVEVELRLIDALPHMFFDRTELDDMAGPFRMEVRTHARNGTMQTSVDHAGAFDVARAFFTKHLR